jgi:hypothetical protein
VHGASLRMLGPGDSAGEMAFFTETASMEVRGRERRVEGGGGTVAAGLGVGGACPALGCCF